jgi:hypothetical protein
MAKSGNSHSQGSGVSGTKIGDRELSLVVLEAELELLEGPFDEVMRGASDAIGRTLSQGEFDDESESKEALDDAEDLLDEAMRAVERVKKEVFGSDS